MKELKNPGALFRPAPFWSWNDKLDEKELRRQIREMAGKGWGSFFMHSRVGLVTEYLSQEWMNLIKASCEEAKKAGIYAWLYDEDKWPSGFAGGEVPEKDKAYRAHALVLLHKGSSRSNDTVICTLKHGEVEYEICERVSSLGNKWFNGTCYVDLMNPEAVRAFLTATHERYKKMCGSYFGKTIRGIFTDEPCYLFYKDYSVPVVPWSKYLPDHFKKLNGYDIKEKLPELFFDINSYRKTRYDFYRSASDLFKQSFTHEYYSWCEKNNLIMTGHFMGEDSLVKQTKWSGDVMSHYEYMHWPGIDKLGRHIEQIVTVKQVSSVCEQLGKERSLSEVFGCVGGQVSFFHRKWIADWQAVLGISFVNHHLSLYSMRGERKRDYPPNFFYQQPWWEDEKDFSDYIARLSMAVSEGNRIVDILVLQPLTSVWCDYSPLDTEHCFSYDTHFRELSLALILEKLDFHYGNESIIAKYGSVKDKSLKIGNYSYSVVIVPPMCNITSAVYELLLRFARAGGKIIFVKELPALIDGKYSSVEFPSAVITANIKKTVKIASEYFSDRIRVLDMFSKNNAISVYVQSRRVGVSFRHLFVNTNEKRRFPARIEMGKYSDEHMAVFDLSNGELYKLNADNGSFDLDFYAAGSFMLICGEEAKKADKQEPAIIGSGIEFKSINSGMPEKFIDSFDCVLNEENVLILNDFSLKIDEKEVYKGPVCGSWHTHFYPLKNGTTFSAEYTFESVCEIRNCFAAIETAENLDSIIFNGESIQALKKRGEMSPFNRDRSWKDINFTKVRLPVINKGKNLLLIKGKKINNITAPGCHEKVPDWKNHFPTEAEVVYLCGNFSVKRINEGKYILMPFKKPDIKHITDSGYPFYSGRVILKSMFSLNAFKGKQIFLKLNGCKAASLRIKINNTECGILRWDPYIIEITNAVKDGENTLEINMATTLVNAFGPNRITDIKKDTCISPRSFIQMDRFQEKYELFDFGLDSAAVYVR